MLGKHIKSRRSASLQSVSSGRYLGWVGLTFFRRFIYNAKRLSPSCQTLICPSRIQWPKSTKLSYRPDESPCTEAREAFAILAAVRATCFMTRSCSHTSVEVGMLFGQRPRLYFPSSIGRDATYGRAAESRCTAHGISEHGNTSGEPDRPEHEHLEPRGRGMGRDAATQVNLLPIAAIVGAAAAVDDL